MTTHTLTLNVPARLYLRLKQCADESERSVEEEMLEIVTSALPERSIPHDLDELKMSLSVLEDAELWQAARSQLTPDAANELALLHEKQQHEGLSSAEQQRAAELEDLFERLVSLRSQAALLLRQRGHDVSVLLSS